MVDPMIGLVGNQTAKVSGGVLSRLLGPTADEMGAQLQAWYKRTNVERVALRAEAKAHTGSAGSIPPRVAAEVFEKAQWADDAFVAEYLSGVLASSRTPEGKDDRGVAWTALVGRLSADQLRLHYIIYREYRRLARGIKFDFLAEVLGRPLVLRLGHVLHAMNLPAESASVNRVLDAAYGLTAEDLAEDLAHGTPEFMAEMSSSGAYVYPSGETYVELSATTRGASLFLHAHGMGAEWATTILNYEIDLDLEWPDGDEVPAVDACWQEDLRTSAS